MTYMPPKVWLHDSENGGKFASINRPVAGARFERELPSGDYRFQLYSMATPNGVKVTLLFEELLQLGVDAQYDAYLIDINQGDQFGDGFVALCPNSKIPALFDRENDIKLFESGSIMTYLAEQFGAFLPASGDARAQTMNWLFWQMGSAPFLGGGFGHFYAYAPEPMQYPIDRYTMEVKRQLDVLDKHLAHHEFINGYDYSIADMAIWPWYGALVLGRLYNAAEFLQVEQYTHLQRWSSEMAERPAVRRGRLVNRNWGDETQQIIERHSAADFYGKDC